MAKGIRVPGVQREEAGWAGGRVTLVVLLNFVLSQLVLLNFV